MKISEDKMRGEVKSMTLVEEGMIEEHMKKEFCRFEGEWEWVHLISVALLVALLAATVASAAVTTAATLATITAASLLVAAARVASSSAAVSSSSSVAPAAATAASSSAGVSEVDFHAPSIKLLLIEVLNSRISLLRRAIGHESEPTRTTSLAVAHDDRI